MDAWMLTSVDVVITSSSSCPSCSWCLSDASSLPAIGTSRVIRGGTASWSAIRRFRTFMHIHVPRGQRSVAFSGCGSGPVKRQRSSVRVIVGGVRSSHAVSPAVWPPEPKSGQRSNVSPVFGKESLHASFSVREAPSVRTSLTWADARESRESTSRIGASIYTATLSCA
jgi:hypothetical protein